LNKDLHIITLDVPYPPDYGGMIDSYYRIQSLHDIGIQIHLHCFEYGRPHSQKLEAICKTVNYYYRRKGLKPHLSSLPYTIRSRSSDALLENLIKDDYPVLFDGLNTTFYLDYPALSARKKFVRTHNIEHRYYMTLSVYEKDLLKSQYFKIESLRLRQYEKILKNADKLFTISAGDNEYFENKYHNSELIPPFHPYLRIESQTGVGEYCLFHGNLSVSENIEIVELLISRVFSKVPYQCIIAGKNPPEHLNVKASPFKNIRIISNPGDEEMTKLIHNAQINVLPALAINGLKLKLLVALCNGRHCLVNEKMINGTCLEQICHIAASAEQMAETIHLLMKEPFTKEMIAVRESTVFKYYNNVTNATKLVSVIFPSS
jgi:hypothetical protein